MSTDEKRGAGRLADNRRALHDYYVLERVEAGLVLQGTEVKSLRMAACSLAGSFAKVEKGQATIYGMNIPPYSNGNRFNHVPDRPRRLLLHRNEIRKLGEQTAQKGLTLIPLNVYLKHGRIKAEIGVCRGKHQEDKREVLKRRTADREAAMAVAAHRRR